MNTADLPADVADLLLHLAVPDKKIVLGYGDKCRSEGYRECIEEMKARGLLRDDFIEFFSIAKEVPLLVQTAEAQLGPFVDGEYHCDASRATLEVARESLRQAIQQAKDAEKVVATIALLWTARRNVDVTLRTMKATENIALALGDALTRVKELEAAQAMPKA